MKTSILLFVSVLFCAVSFGQELSSLDRRLFVAVSSDLNEAQVKSLLAQGANINAVNGANGGETLI